MRMDRLDQCPGYSRLFCAGIQHAEMHVEICNIFNALTFPWSRPHRESNFPLAVQGKLIYLSERVSVNLINQPITSIFICGTAAAFIRGTVAARKGRSEDWQRPAGVVRSRAS